MKAQLTFLNIQSDHIKNCFTEALKHFELLQGHPICVQQVPSQQYTMRVQPVINRNIFNKEQRGYRIDISNHAKLETYIRVEDLPEKVLIGWFAHELGHMMDYLDRSALGLLRFGLGYLLFSNYRLGAERRADLFAIQCGMAEYIMATKQYILYQSNLPDHYLKRIKSFYMSPEEVALMINVDPKTMSKRDKLI